MTEQTITAMVLDLDGNTEVIEIPPGQFQQAFREHCGAQYFDHLELHKDLDVWVDDEGLLREPVEVNEYATLLRDQFWAENGMATPMGWPPLAGKALLTGGVDNMGDTLSLSPELAAELETWFQRWREQP